MQRQKAIEQDDKENLAPAPKRAKGPNAKVLPKPTFARPVARQPFKFAPPKKGPTTTKPFSFMARAKVAPKRQDEEVAEHDSEIIFKGAHRVKAKARTISAARLAQLAQPRRRVTAATTEESRQKQVVNKPKSKSVSDVKRMMARAPVVVKSNKATTVPVDKKSALERRAEERKQYETQRNKRLMTENEQRQKEEEIKKAKVAEELKENRKKLGHRPEPIRQYKQVERIRAKQPTKPITPKFKTAKRKRNTDI